MSKKYQLKTPFEKIALSLSGGGYRAAAFHLGSMAYLHHAKFNGVSLLKNVKIISTVSGGTITGVFYAYRINEGDTFPEICKKLFKIMGPGDDTLGKVDLLKEPLGFLSDNEKWKDNKHKRRNLINAIALVYDENITDGATFDTFLKKNPNSHLDEVVFNTTEFTTGNLFLFKNKGSMGVSPFGIVPKELKPFIKLSDIIAASSCFPGGFEPLAFPGDFISKDLNSKTNKDLEKFNEKYKSEMDENDRERINEKYKKLSEKDRERINKKYKKLSKKEKEEKCKEEMWEAEFKKEHGKPPGAIALMDGGICDNQGISSILKSENYKRGGDVERDYYYDLVIISDVASPNIEKFKFSKDKENSATDQEVYMNLSQEELMRKGNKIQGWINWFLWGLFCISGLAIILSGLKGNWLLGSGTVGFLFSVILIALLYKARKSVIATIAATKESLTGKDTDDVIPFFQSKIEALKWEQLTFSEITNPVLDRIGSLKTLVNSVFLKQIRNLHYADFYDNYQWKYRRISNLIYELSEDDFLIGRNMGSARKYCPWPEGKERDDEKLNDDHKKELMAKILGTNIPRVAGEAKEFGTNLWFTPKDKEEETLKDLITTGQFTMCYNLICYINEIRDTPDVEKLTGIEKEAIHKHRHYLAGGYTKLKGKEKAAVDKLRDRSSSDYKDLTQAAKEEVDKLRRLANDEVYTKLNQTEKKLVDKLRKENPGGSGFEELPQAEKDNIEQLHQQLMSDWEKFKKDPRFMLDRFIG